MATNNSQLLLSEPSSDGPNSQLILNMRNTRRELTDIRFKFWQAKDSAEGIAEELLSAGLIVEEDLGAVADNLEKLITQPPPSKNLSFRTSAYDREAAPDENVLLGFAQLSLAEYWEIKVKV